VGREFIHTFEQWADDYDRSVFGGDREYKEVFKDYDRILETAAAYARGAVLEFGVGTGNLTKKLITHGFEVTGIEPSKKMREKAMEKLPNLHMLDGDFLNFPKLIDPIDTIISSFAFHHLTDQEKDQAIDHYSRLLPINGRIVFIDTLFDSVREKKKIHHWASSHGYTRLLNDLQTEYYPLRQELADLFQRHHFQPYFKQLNRFAWLIVANKNE
jgi:putative AdoMet-dependent methyltransferase